MMMMTTRTMIMIMTIVINDDGDAGDVGDDGGSDDYDYD